MIICLECSEQKPLKARGLCGNCYQKHWVLENTSRHRTTKKAWRKRNPQKMRAEADRRNERKTAEQREQDIRRANKWATANPERRREIASKWVRANPNKVRANVQARRTRKTAAGGSCSAEEWQAILEEYGNVCAGCGCVGPLEADHIIPVKLDGPSWPWNLQPLCRKCNLQKGAKFIVSYGPYKAG